MLPPLTTVRMSCADIAQVAFATLRHRIEPGFARHIARPVETSLIVRQSTAAPQGERPAPARHKRSSE
jgi:DNA-binding LacI/PurR family transcriptional regulator